MKSVCKQCGWSETGLYLPAKCPNCDGKMEIISEDEESIENDDTYILDMEEEKELMASSERTAIQ